MVKVKKGLLSVLATEPVGPFNLHSLLFTLICFVKVNFLKDILLGCLSYWLQRNLITLV